MINQRNQSSLLKTFFTLPISYFHNRDLKIFSVIGNLFVHKSVSKAQSIILTFFDVSHFKYNWIKYWAIVQRNIIMSNWHVAETIGIDFVHDLIGFNMTPILMESNQFS